MLFASEMRLKNYLCGITYLGRKGKQDAGEESRISHSSSGNALSLNISNGFHITLGKIAVACNHHAAKDFHNLLRELSFTKN